MDGKHEEITVVIHGTFANATPEPGKPDLPKWWRATEPGLTAERLQDALIRLDPARASTVWVPGQDSRDGDMTYEELVEWTSANKHKDRAVAAHRLTSALRTLANRRGCTPDDPLQVNYVAHSHGGNVVLESLKHVATDDIVRPRQIALLGTPLTWRYPDPRLFYLSIIFLFFSGWIAAEWQLFTNWNPDGGDLSFGEELFLSVVLIVVLFWTAFGVVRVLRALFGGGKGRPAYGPKPSELTQKLGGRPVALVISEEDEADLMLQLGAAPLDTYRALVRGRPALKGVGLVQKVVRTPLRLIEFLFVRPFAYAIAVPLVEILLERFGLGFPFRSVLMRNYEMITWTKHDPYAHSIVKVSVDADELGKALEEAKALARAERMGEAAPLPSSGEPQTVTERERIQELRKILLETISGLTSQVHLSHSGYYQAQTILDGVARAIVAPDEQAGAVLGDFMAAQPADLEANST